MTDLLKRLRDLHERATPGPWRWRRQDHQCVFGGGGVIVVDYSALVLISNPQITIDAKLIAEMRNALPLLLDVVEAARRGVADTTVVHASDWRNQCVPDCTACVLVAALAALDKEDAA